MKLRYLVFVYSLFLIGCIDQKKSADASSISVSDVEQALIGKLLKNYNKIQKPGGTTQVKFSLDLQKIISVEAKSQVVMLNVILQHEWIDKRLIWSKNILLMAHEKIQILIIINFFRPR
jgi:hypothetical protein